MPRKLPDWLSGLRTYVEDTEAPRTYWLWGGIFTICAALQRQVWIEYGLENVYPNLYLLIVAPPGERKGYPPRLAKEMLEKIQVPVAVDSSSKRALTEELAETARTEQFFYKGKPRPMATLAVISKEMSSLLAVDPKGVIEVLTDLYDSHDVWKYKTSGKGEDFLYNVCVSCFIVTTPTWFVNNLPQEAIGGGYTSRHIILSSSGRYGSVPWPPLPDKKLYSSLISDLQRINSLTGPYEIDPTAREVFSSWYKTIPQIMTEAKDERVHGYLNRIHVVALKVAMALRASYSDELLVEPDDMGRAIDLLTPTVQSASEALGGHGRSRYGPDLEIIMKQIKFHKKIRLHKLLSMNWRNLNLTELKEILEDLRGMKLIGKGPIVDGEENQVITWVGKEEKEDGRD